MTISKIYPDINFGGVNVQGSVGYGDASYSNAREGAGAPSITLGTGISSTGNIGQALSSGSYSCQEVFLSFDTSGLDPNAIISSVSLNIFVPTGTDKSAVDFQVQARLDDYGSSIEAGDFVPGSQLASKLLLATLETSIIVENQYNIFSQSGLDFINSLNLSGKTRIVLCSKNQVDNIAPGDGSPNFEFIGLYIVKPLNVSRNAYLLVVDNSVRPPGASESPDSTWSAWA